MSSARECAGVSEYSEVMGSAELRKSSLWGQGRGSTQGPGKYSWARECAGVSEYSEVMGCAELREHSGQRNTQYSRVRGVLLGRRVRKALGSLGEQRMPRGLRVFGGVFIAQGIRLAFEVQRRSVITRETLLRPNSCLFTLQVT